MRKRTVKMGLAGLVLLLLFAAVMVVDLAALAEAWFQGMF